MKTDGGIELEEAKVEKPEDVPVIEVEADAEKEKLVEDENEAAKE